jgi:hypothetical protein
MARSFFNINDNAFNLIIRQHLVLAMGAETNLNP